MENCAICGAPLNGPVCEYCGYRNNVNTAPGHNGTNRQAAGTGGQAGAAYAQQNQDRQAQQNTAYNTTYAQQNQNRQAQQNTAWNTAYAQQNQNRQAQAAPDWASSPYVSPKSRWAALFLCFFFGIFGAHRFYVGKAGTGLLWLMTFGLFGIGWLVDLLLIAAGAFSDSRNLMLKR